MHFLKDWSGSFIKHFIIYNCIKSELVTIFGIGNNLNGTVLVYSFKVMHYKQELHILLIVIGQHGFWAESQIYWDQIL